MTLFNLTLLWRSLSSVFALLAILKKISRVKVCHFSSIWAIGKHFIFCFEGPIVIQSQKEAWHFFFFFDNDIEFFTTTSIQKQTGKTQVKSSSFIRALNDYKKEESEKKKFQGVFGIQVILKWFWPFRFPIIKKSYQIRATISAISCSYTSIVKLNIKSFDSMVTCINRANRFAWSVITMHT